VQNIIGKKKSVKIIEEHPIFLQKENGDLPEEHHQTEKVGEMRPIQLYPTCQENECDP
jgi:hypothetical protein